MEISRKKRERGRETERERDGERETERERDGERERRRERENENESERNLTGIISTQISRYFQKVSIESKYVLSKVNKPFYLTYFLSHYLSRSLSLPLSVPPHAFFAAAATTYYKIVLKEIRCYSPKYLSRYFLILSLKYEPWRDFKIAPFFPV